MNIVNFLILFTFSGLFFASGYLLYRHTYTQNIKKEKDLYANRRDVVKPTVILILILILIYLVFMYVFYKVTYETGFLEFTSNNQLLLIIYAFLFMLFAFSNGVYFYSILMEALIIKKIETNKEYVKAFHFIHGPVSHFLVYFCGGMIFIMNGLFEYLSNSIHIMSEAQRIYLGITAVIFGLMYFGGAVGSHAWQDQITTSMLMVLFHFSSVLLLDIPYGSHPYNFFFAIASTIYCVCLLTYFIVQRNKGIKYKYAWDK